MSTPDARLIDVIVHVTRDEILPLRHAVLRPHLPLSAAMYPEDSNPEIFHLGMRLEGRLIACATFFPEPLDGRPAWRLRGMATLPEHRNAGHGGRLLEAGAAEIASRGGTLLWCAGRKSAVPFYLRHGFVIQGEEFEVPALGPHFVLVRDLTAAPAVPA